MSKHINKESEKYKYSHYAMPYISSSTPIFQMISDKELIIEGASTLLYYDDAIVKIKSNFMYITISGYNLSIKCLANENLAVCGKISDIKTDYI